MANKMLIDATHPEETRVVVVRGNRVEEFDFESANRRQLRGNIYLAKVTRVEPSLQAAFVDYGGNRHGFLAFSEIHPDYYQIPVADRQALIADEERAHREAEAEIDRRASRHRDRRPPAAAASHVVKSEAVDEDQVDNGDLPAHNDQAAEADSARHDEASSAEAGAESSAAPIDADPVPPADAPIQAVSAESSADTPHADEPAYGEAPGTVAAEAADALPASNGDNGATVVSESGTQVEDVAEEEMVESVGGADALEEVQERMPRFRRQYKIQEVIKRRQIMLVQVVKEERGTKGAALTSYLSLAGRYSVLMPNTARGGGISRKITNSQDRKRLKEMAQDLEVPEGMGVILRTAGANRTKTEVKRDFEYLLRMWETVRDLTLKSTAPMLVYEEGSLIKRSIRDLYNKDIDEVLVAGDEGHKEAKDFMRMLMPSHAKNVKPYKDTQPVFSRFGIESQLDAMFTPVMQLRSGGYIVLNQTEALVSIDVNSGRATREHHIEDTALKTNMEASEEIARQLRLRDLAGLIVIDFIDMDEKRNNRTVERRLKESLKHDRARIQVGRISHFGLLEMSRQRIRSSVLESSTDKCPHCGGTGHVRSVSSVALHLLRMLEEMLLKGATHNLLIRTRPEVALYVLNHKRAHLRTLEERFRIAITVNADDSVGAAQPFAIEKGEQVHSLEAAKALVAQAPAIAPAAEEEEVDDAIEAEYDEEPEVAEEAPQPVAAENGDGHRRRRRRRGRRGEAREDEFIHETQPGQPAVGADDGDGETQVGEPRGDGGEQRGDGGEQRGDGERGDGRRRRRGRRGGRRNRRGRDEGFREGNGYPAPEDAPAHPVAAASVEPELASAAADLDGPVMHEPTLAQPARAEPMMEPPHAPEPAPIEVQPEPPRRRSTVREAVPILGFDAPSAPSEPAPPALPVPEAPPMTQETQEATDAAAPRRRGWWSRRG